ncbi:MAG: SDR family oxidoreductase [Mesorhizobium sp.]
MSHFLMIGAGYSARAFARRVLADGHRLCGTTRTAEKAGRLRDIGIEPVLFDGSEISPDLDAELARATHLIVSAAPSEEGDPFLTARRQVFRDRMPDLRHIAYLSTVGVYGNHDGAWVTEDSECRPRPGRSDHRLETEAQWRDAAATLGAPLAILRLSGIYGPGRNALVNLANGSARRIIKPGQIFNRIHVDDIAGSLGHLCARTIGGVFNVTDDEPSPPQDVIEFAAGLMGVEPPPAIDFATADLSPMARSFYGENKRVSNAKLKASGYRFAMPNYRKAFAAMWRDDRWRSEA